MMLMMTSTSMSNIFFSTNSTQGQIVMRLRIHILQKVSTSKITIFSQNIHKSFRCVRKPNVVRKHPGTGRANVYDVEVDKCLMINRCTVMSNSLSCMLFYVTLPEDVTTRRRTIENKPSLAPHGGRHNAFKLSGNVTVRVTVRPHLLLQSLLASI